MFAAVQNRPGLTTKCMIFLASRSDQWVFLRSAPFRFVPWCPAETEAPVKPRDDESVTNAHTID
jgi:hypothetical protein